MIDQHKTGLDARVDGRPAPSHAVRAMRWRTRRASMGSYAREDRGLGPYVFADRQVNFRGVPRFLRDFSRGAMLVLAGWVIGVVRDGVAGGARGADAGGVLG